MSTPIGSGGQYTPGSPEDQAARQKAQAQSANAVGAAGSAILGSVYSFFGIKHGAMDQFLNTAFYSLCAVGGVGMMMIGLNLLVKEVPGVGGVGSVVTGAVGGTAKKVGTFAAGAVAPEAVIPAKIARKVVGNLEVGGKHSK